MKFFLSTLVCFFFITVGYSQTKVIRGNIILSENVRELSHIFVQNKNTSNYSVTDIMGGFDIHASVGDTLRFFGDFLKDREIIITPKHTEAKKIFVSMESDVIELDELVANPVITGNLRVDLENIKYQDTISKLYSQLGLDIKNRDIVRREKEKDLFPKIGKIPIPTQLNIEAMYKVLSGYYKKQRRLYNYETLDQTTKGILKSIPEEYFVNKLKIPKGEIFNFVFYAVQVNKETFTHLLKVNNILEIKILLEGAAKIYLKRLINETDSQSYTPN